MSGSRPKVQTMWQALLIICCWVTSIHSAENWPLATNGSFTERERAHPLLQPADIDRLVFPRTAISQAHKVTAGNRLLPRYMNGFQYVWSAIPFSEKHQAYLDQRDQIYEKSGIRGLYKWCMKNDLVTCAEYELRRELRRIGSFTRREYKYPLQKWLKLADERQLDISFPLPLKGEWHVVVDKTRHHRAKAGAAYAFDMVKHDRQGLAWKDSPQVLSNHYAWDQPVIAQADGIVMQAVDTFRDNRFGQFAGYDTTNYITVYYGQSMYAIYAHLKQGSLTVKKGDTIEAGQELGRVGNSGRSGMPHLHFTMLDVDYLSVKGRYHFQVRSSPRRKWSTVKGKDLPEGTYVRNIPD